jgi:hypothetical protein
MWCGRTGRTLDHTKDAALQAALAEVKAALPASPS